MQNLFKCRNWLGKKPPNAADDPRRWVFYVPLDLYQNNNLQESR